MANCKNCIKADVCKNYESKSTIACKHYAEAVVKCKDCKYNGLHTCPIAYIEKQTLQFVNHDPDFWCAKGELKKDGEK